MRSPSHNCSPAAQARDEDGNRRLSGSDDFVVELCGGPPAAFGAVVDRGDGTYAVTYSTDRAGEYLIHVSTGVCEQESTVKRITWSRAPLWPVLAQNRPLHSTLPWGGYETVTHVPFTARHDIVFVWHFVNVCQLDALRTSPRSMALCGRRRRARRRVPVLSPRAAGGAAAAQVWRHRRRPQQGDCRRRDFVLRRGQGRVRQQVHDERAMLRLCAADHG